MDQGQRQQADPRSPVQPDKSRAAYVAIALVAAAAIWTVQQYAVQDSTPPARSVPSSEPAHSAKGEVRGVFSADDYPAEAQRNNEEGTVQAELAVDAKGRVRDCTIIRSSGHRSLDDATCNILKRRARFRPARDVNGKAVPDSVVTPPVVWRLEG
jgi:protein TonB